MLEELDKQLVRLLEKLQPADPNSPKNVKLRNKFESDLAKIFKQMGNAFPMSKIDRIYNKYVKE